MFKVNMKENGPKISSFLVTINSNQTAASIKRKKIPLAEFIGDFEGQVKDILSDKGMYKPVGDPLLLVEDIQKLSVEKICTEIAPKTKTYHIHARVDVFYRSDTSGCLKRRYAPVFEFLRPQIVSEL